MQRDWDRLEKCAGSKLINIHKGELKALHLGRNNSTYQHGASQLESSLAEKDLLILVDTPS